MKCAVLHLSDLHISIDSKDQIRQYLKSMSNRIPTELYGIDVLVIAITGDIADKGQDSEYDIARMLLEEMIQDIESNFPGEIGLMFCPGNHDNNLTHDQSARDELIKRVVSGEDVSLEIISQCCKPQIGFRNFASKFSFSEQLHSDELLHSSMLKPNENCEPRIVFMCLNTAWLSQKHEIPAQLLFPIEKFGELDLPQNSIVIGLMHHPLNWLNPNGKDYHKIRDHVLSSFHVLLLGHEHSATAQDVRNLDNSVSTMIFQAPKLSASNPGYNLLIIDTTEEDLKYKTSVTLRQDDKLLEWMRKNLSVIYQGKLADDYKKYLDAIDIPIAHPHKEQLTLSDVFVEPDVQILQQDNSGTEYENLFKAVMSAEEGKVFIVGKGQSGKTSSVKSLFSFLSKRDIKPILIKGPSIETKNFLKHIRSAVNSQYTNLNWGQYCEIYDKEDRYLIIDDLDKSRLSIADKLEAIDPLLTTFSKVVITSGEFDLFYNDTKHTEFFWANSTALKILPLGHVKRDELIKKWIDVNSKTREDEEMYVRRLESMSRGISEILKTRIPPYPFAILVILQHMRSVSGESDQVAIEYGDCYDLLINFTLRKVVGAQRKSAYVRFLSELAYRIYQKAILDITDISFQEFFSEYSVQYPGPELTSSETLDNLLRSRLLIREDGVIRFAQPYFYHYFLAKYMASKQTYEDIKSDVKRMYRNIHVQRNANVLTYLAHMLNDDSDLWDEFLGNMELQFSGLAEETLNKDRTAFLQNLATGIHKFIVNERQSIIEHRETEQKLKDDIERRRPDQFNDDDDIDGEDDLDLSYRLLHVVRFTEVTGQILKCKYGDLSLVKLNQFISQTIKANMRMLNLFLTNHKDITEFLKPLICEAIEEYIDEPAEVVEMHARNMLFHFFNHLILNVLYGVAVNIGSEPLIPHVKKVCDEMGNPAQVLIDLMVRSEYGFQLPMNELKELRDNYKSDKYITHALTNIVVRHLYLHNVGLKTMQRLSAMFNIDMQTQRFIQRQDSLRQEIHKNAVDEKH